MKQFGWACVVLGLSAFGCHIQHNSGEGDIFDGDEGCDESSTTKETAADAGTRDAHACTSHAECAAGSYCDTELGRCLASAACDDEADCTANMNCDATRATCTPAAAPTCAEVASEADCVARAECETIYAGVGCSCGQDCVCKGGEPGCVCESFEFFRCASSEI